MGMMNVIRDSFRQAFFLIHASQKKTQFGEGISLKEACTSKDIESYENVCLQVSMARVSKVFSVRNLFKSLVVNKNHGLTFFPVSEIPVSPSPCA